MFEYAAYFINNIIKNHLLYTCILLNFHGVLHKTIIDIVFIKAAFLTTRFLSIVRQSWNSPLTTWQQILKKIVPRKYLEYSRIHRYSSSYKFKNKL